MGLQRGGSLFSSPIDRRLRGEAGGVIGIDYRTMMGYHPHDLRLCAPSVQYLKHAIVKFTFRVLGTTVPPSLPRPSCTFLVIARSREIQIPPYISYILCGLREGGVPREPDIANVSTVLYLLHRRRTFTFRVLGTNRGSWSNRPEMHLDAISRDRGSWVVATRSKFGYPTSE